MPLDHYVSQVHLKNFYSPELKNRMYAIRKADLGSFTPKSEDVCRISKNSTNRFLSEERIIEEFLKDIEPKYNLAVSEIKDGIVSSISVYVVSGFVAYISVCSPAGMRLNAEPLEKIVKETGKILDGSGRLPPPPPELEATSLSELLDSGKVIVNVDEKFPQAMGISSMLSLVKRFGNARWEILINELHDSPFFTSDYPLALEPTQSSSISNTIIPLTPRIAVRILPDPSLDPKEFDLGFRHFRFRLRTLKRSEVIEINRCIVRCAEALVFFPEFKDWIPGFISKNRAYRIESITSRIPTERGSMIIPTKKVVESTTNTKS